MSNDTHYLEAEINSLFQSDNNMWNFVQRASLDGIWYWDLERPENLWLSEEYWQCLDIDPATREHSPEEFISVVFEEDLPKILDNLERHYADPSVTYEQIVRFKHSSGSTVWVRCRGMAQRNAQGKAIRMFGAHNNITTIKNAEQELLQVNQELEQFAYRTSHDLRSPLVSSIGLLSYIDQEIPKDNKRLNKSVSIVKKSLTGLETLVADILELTKARKLKEDEKLIDIDHIIQNTCEKLSHMENYGRIKFDKKLEFDGKLFSQPNQIILIIENLVSNAIKYQDLDKKLPFVKIFTYEKNSNFIFEIVDNGLGIPKDKQGDLFSMFHRFHPRVSFGSGLGMYMIKKSIDAINGKIEYEDTDTGSTFRVIIPNNNKHEVE